MKSMNFKPALRYRLTDSAKGGAVFIGIFVLVVALALCYVRGVFSDGVQSGSITGYSFAACITMFVFGICTVREDLRLMLQNGVGRRTVFFVELAAAAIVSLGLALCGELLLAIARAIAGEASGLTITDLFALLFTQSETGALPFREHVLSLLFCTLLLCWASYGGMLISLLFYRLPRPWNIIAGVALPLLVINGIPILFGIGAPFIAAMVQLVFQSAGSVLCTMLIGMLVCAGLSWLLLRRAPVCAAKE